MKRRIGQYKARVTLFSAVAVVVFTMLTGTAFAADSTTPATATADLTSGTLNISSALGAGSFAGTLSGAAQVFYGTDFTGFSINDPRGTGAGWEVTMVATQFLNGDARTVPDDIALHSLTAPLFDVTVAATGSSAVPGSTLPEAAPIDTGGTGVLVAACSANGQGMGTYDFTALATAWKLALTADEYAGTYSSTVTTTLAPLTLF